MALEHLLLRHITPHNSDMITLKFSSALHRAELAINSVNYGHTHIKQTTDFIPNLL
jgi:hypothetical protein